ncbi:glycosyltransferase [Egicoccus halophilus]|uniref:Glycosyl transferase n=1 Tax=Egicoccus halophilus TaxID=1670830 RepID=A0A8J3A9F3_9ACTN|nr:glycosyltransferase [Egicoccus halophilus]GGI05448.1 glycosyl transferase [Egicoccus halophilus]
MRVLVFVHAFNGRAIADVATVLAEQTARLGHEVLLVAGSAPTGRPAVAGTRTLDLSISSSRTWPAIPRLRAVIRRFRPDVVYAHGNGPSRAAVLATRWLRHRPFVVTVEHNHYSSYAWTHRRVRDLVNARLLPLADAVVGVAPEIAEDLTGTFPGVRDKVAVVPPPLTRWDRLAVLAAEDPDHPWFADDADVPVVVSVANVHPRKDPETLLRAVARVNERTGRTVRLAVVGRPSDAGLQARLEAFARSAGIADRIALLGFVSNPLPLVARADVFALTSRNEGLPLSLLEALALGTPVVSTDCPSGPRWLLEDGRYGELVPVGDVEAVADGILRVLDDPVRREQLRREGPQRVAPFVPERVAAALLALLDPSVQSGSPGRGSG